jgi:GNAT superfamily N-acetyltransferase
MPKRSSRSSSVNEMHDEAERIRTYIAQVLGADRRIPTTNPFSVNVIPLTKGDTDILRVEVTGGPGWYRFDIIPAAGISANGSLRVHDGWRGQGIGGSLVAAREDVCKRNGIERIIIGENTNDPFWWSKGYEPIQDRAPYLSLARAGVIRYEELREGYGLPLVKRL